MPLLNGYQFCSKVKSDMRTCHIPVIMLTAKGSVDEQIEGVVAGADVYIPKPFNPDYLISVLRGTIRNRKRIQHMIIDNNTFEQEEIRSHLGKMDRELLRDFDKKIEAELSNPEFSIDDLAIEMNLSRSTFYRKIKTLTGLSPNDFIRVYRVKRAAELIEGGNYTLSEISDMTGFNTQSYFSYMFKKHFGVTPSEYRSSLFPSS
jgi:AraC-like DNA-binding protein